MPPRPYNAGAQSLAVPAAHLPCLPILTMQVRKAWLCLPPKCHASHSSPCVSQTPPAAERTLEPAQTQGQHINVGSNIEITACVHMPTWRDGWVTAGLGGGANSVGTESQDPSQCPCPILGTALQCSSPILIVALSVACTGHCSSDNTAVACNSRSFPCVLWLSHEVRDSTHASQPAALWARDLLVYMR